MSDERTDGSGERDRVGGRGGYTTYEIDPAETPSEAIVRAVAAATGQQPTAMTPLFDTIDPDALDLMFARTGDRGVGSAGQLSLRYEGCDVYVTATEVSVREIDDE